MKLTIKVEERQDGVFIVSLDGGIDSVTYEELEKKLAPITNKDTQVLVFNMEGVTYISSLGLRVLTKTREAIEENDGIFVMTNLQPQIQKVFDVVKTLPGINIFESVEQADIYLDKLQNRDSS